MEATLDLVAAHGLHSATTAMIAEQADVSPATIYHHFTSKEILIAKTYSELEQRVSRAVTEKYLEDGAIRERFRHIAYALLRYWVSSPMEFKFLEQFNNSPYGITHRQERILGNNETDIATKLFNEAKAKQVVKDLSLSVLLALSFGPLLVIARDHALGFIQVDDCTMVSVVAGCWDAIRR